MRSAGMLTGVALGVAIGAVAAVWLLGQPRPAGAASNDRYQDYIMATGAVSVNARVQTDGVWLLDYRAGKLLGTVIDRGQGKIVGWAEVDLTTEFAIAPRQDVHFMMTTGYVTQGQSALYMAETTTGQVRRVHDGAGRERRRRGHPPARPDHVPPGRSAQRQRGPAARRATAALIGRQLQIANTLPADGFRGLRSSIA